MEPAALWTHDDALRTTGSSIGDPDVPPTFVGGGPGTEDAGGEPAVNPRGRSTAFGRNLTAALGYPFESWRGTVGLVGVTFATYALLVSSAMPEYSLQMLGDGLHRFDTVLVAMTVTIYRTDGPAGIAIVVSYALLSGVAVVNAATQLRLVGLSGLTDLSGIVPGLLASGCASCGAGLIGFLGFAGGLAALPYDGALLRIAGLALLVFFLGRAGHPERCVVPETVRGR